MTIIEAIYVDGLERPSRGFYNADHEVLDGARCGIPRRIDADNDTWETASRGELDKTIN